MEDIIKKLYEQGKLLGACRRFRGNENLDELMELFKSPQGLEFCMKNHFPNSNILRALKNHHLEKYGVYIDAGQISLANPVQVVLIGKTSATINCNKLMRTKVAVMRGSNAVIHASNWAVVAIEQEPGCHVIKNVSENAVIL